MLSIQIDTKSLELVIYHQFNNIKLSFFASHMKSSFTSCTFNRCFPLFISKCHLAFPNHWLCYTFLPIVFLEMLMILFSLQWLPKSIFNLVQMNKGEKCSTIWLSCKLVNYPRFHWRMRWSSRQHSEIEIFPWTEAKIHHHSSWAQSGLGITHLFSWTVGRLDFVCSFRRSVGGFAKPTEV